MSVTLNFQQKSSKRLRSSPPIFAGTKFASCFSSSCHHMKHLKTSSMSLVPSPTSFDWSMSHTRCSSVPSAYSRSPFAAFSIPYTGTSSHVPTRKRFSRSGASGCSYAATRRWPTVAASPCSTRSARLMDTGERTRALSFTSASPSGPCASTSIGCACSPNRCELSTSLKSSQILGSLARVAMMGSSADPSLSHSARCSARSRSTSRPSAFSRCAISCTTWSRSWAFFNMAASRRYDFSYVLNFVMSSSRRLLCSTAANSTSAHSCTGTVPRPLLVESGKFPLLPEFIGTTCPFAVSVACCIFRRF
mmetsp:Transcript_33828/g.80105  ORF Transcript_33828/g.80105 Transcript_33828/m.80105 type:complete len:306 (+) Transcript_33828:823-1740(+)